MAINEGGTGKLREKLGEPLLLWTGMVLPPTAWMLQLFVLYMLEDFIACTPGSQTPGAILGFGVRTLALFITAVLALATAAAGALSFSLYRSMGAEADEGVAEGRARWMAIAGMMSSLLFLAIIVIKVVPPLLIGVCQAPL
jgi:hypothetical protein